MSKKKQKPISDKERKRRVRQRQGQYLYTPDGLLSTTKVQGGYRLHNAGLTGRAGNEHGTTGEV